MFTVGQQVWVAHQMQYHPGGEVRWEVEAWYYLNGDRNNIALVSDGWRIGGNYVEFFPTSRVFVSEAQAKDYCDRTSVESTPPAVRRRTKAEVLESRNHGPAGGCCNRHADNMACDCLEEAE